MMKKKQKSFRLSTNRIAFINHLKEQCNFKTDTEAVDFALEIVYSYFRDDQLRIEAEMYEPEDGRIKKD